MNKRKQKKPTKANTPKAPANKTLMTRRNAIKLLFGIPVVGVAGAAIHRYDVKNRDLHDLAAVGNGAQVIVQIHDPSCPLCRRLMGNTRTALKERNDFLYRVADVTTGIGHDFQQKYDVPNVTLLIFNGEGKLVDTVRGVTPVAELTERFDRLSVSSG